MTLPVPGEAEPADRADSVQEEVQAEPEREVSPNFGKMAAAAKKIATLRRSLEFDGDLESKVVGIHTSRNMLLFMHQHVLYKFQSLHEIGMVDEQSHAVLDCIMKKTESLLAAGADDQAMIDPTELAAENESLKRQLNALYEKHVKSDIISGAELALQEEKSRLQSRLGELKKRYDYAKMSIGKLTDLVKKLEVIHTRYKMLTQRNETHERNTGVLEKNAKILQELEAQNKLLKGRVEHQERLLQSMAWENPKQRELMDSITELDEKKQALKELLGPFGDELDTAVSNIDDEEHKRNLQSLVQENRSLYAELETQDYHLESAQPLEQDVSLLSNMERLQEDTFHLAEVTQAKQHIAGILASKEDKTNVKTEMLSALSRENNALKHALDSKARNIKVLDTDPGRSKMLETIISLKKDNNRYQLEIENLNHVVTGVSERNYEIEKKCDQLKNAYKENQHLKQEALIKDTLLADHKKKEEEIRSMKKEFYKMQAACTKIKYDYEKAVADNIKLEIKIKKIRSDYEGMITEYNKLFDEE